MGNASATKKNKKSEINGKQENVLLGPWLIASLENAYDKITHDFRNMRQQEKQKLLQQQQQPKRPFPEELHDKQAHPFNNNANNTSENIRKPIDKTSRASREQKKWLAQYYEMIKYDKLNK